MITVERTMTVYMQTKVKKLFMVSGERKNSAILL